MRRLGLFICFVLLWCNPLFADEPYLRLLSDNSETWEARDAPQEANDEWEILAIRAAIAKATVSQGRLTASYVRQKESYDIVTVEEAPESIKETIYRVKSFEISNGKICGDTNSNYLIKPDPEREKIARKIAIDYLQGKGRNVPEIYNGMMYLVEYDGKCLLTVNEMDRRTLNFPYRYNCCR